MSTHAHNVILFNDGTELNVYIPHYFERIGEKRKYIKELEKDRIKKLNRKLNKIKCIIKK